MLRVNHQHPPSMVAWIALVIATIALALAWNITTRINPEVSLGEALRLQLPGTFEQDETEIRNEVERIQLSLDNSLGFDSLATGVAGLRQTLQEKRAILAQEDITDWDEELAEIGEQLEAGTEDAREDLRQLLARIKERLAL